MHPYIYVHGFAIESYPLMYATGAAVSVIVALCLAVRFKLSIIHVLLLAVSAIASGIVGAALTYALVTYTPSEMITLLKEHRLSLGLVFYGGLIFGAAFTLLIAVLLKLNISDYFRALIPAIPIGHAIGRIGCYLSGCCYGRWMNSVGARIPVQLIESLCLIVIFAFLLRAGIKGSRGLVYRYIFMYAPLRFMLEFLRGDEIRGAFWGLSTSQWISLVLVIIAVFIFRYNKTRTH